MRNFIQQGILGVFLNIFTGIVTMTAHGQVSLGIQAGPGLPVGRFRSVVNVGVGFDAFVRYDLPEKKYGFGVRSGYALFISRTLELAAQPVRYNLIPFMLTGRYMLAPIGVLKPYLELDAGLFIVRTRRNIGANSIYKTTLVNLSAAPGLGLEYALRKRWLLGLNARFPLLFPRASDTPKLTNSFIQVNLGLSYTW